MSADTKYKDFDFKGPGPGNGTVDRDLAEIFVGLVRSIGSAKRICDLGCGNGYLASRIASLGCDVTGIDASETGIDIAERNYANKSLSFLRAEFGTDLKAILPNSDDFDVVVSSDVIEHLYRPSVLVEAAAGLLRPGGYLIVGTPYHGYIKNFAISVLDKWDAHHGVHWDGGHIKFFSQNTLGNLLFRHGFEDLKFHFSGRFPWLWKHMICVARRGI